MAGIKYWVQVGGEWYPCALAKRMRGSRLHFDLHDGTAGVAMYGEWKRIDKPPYPENSGMGESNNRPDQR